MIALESMAVEMPEVEGHPNRAGFRGVLTVVDVASERAPSGSKGHRVMLTRAAAEAALPSLLGMALDYAPSFDRHDQRRKVGVITSAEIVERNLEVGGYLYAKDFPEIVEEIAKWGRQSDDSLPSLTGREKAPAIKDAAKVVHSISNAPLPRLAKTARPFDRLRAGCGTSGKTHPGIQAVGNSRIEGEGARLRAKLAAAVMRIRGLGGQKAARRESVVDLRAEAAGQLGMSYEVADVMLADARSRVWTLTRVTFTGAAILRRDKAAYENTWIALS